MGLWDWIFHTFSRPRTASAPAPHPSPVFDRPWRSIEWRQDKENLLATITNVTPGNTEVNTFKILLHGPIGAGKSSFINSVDSALQGRIATRALANSVNTDPSFTLECKTYKVKKDTAGSYFPFTFTDIAGLHNEGLGIQADDIISVFKGHISDGYTFNPIRSITEEDPKYKRSPGLQDRIHCLVAVLPADTVSMMDDNIIEQMKVVRMKARHLGIPQVIIMTKVDALCPLVNGNLQKIYTSKKIKDKMKVCSSRLGVPVSCIFPVKNYHEERTTDDTMDILIFDALKNMIHFANDYVNDQKDD